MADIRRSLADPGQPVRRQAVRRMRGHDGVALHEVGFCWGMGLATSVEWLRGSVDLESLD